MRTQLNGEVVNDGDLWVYQYFDIPAFSPQTVRQALEATPEGEELVLEINSVGGSVFAGHEMYTVLRSAQRKTVAEVQSIAASAASVAMLGCQEVVASPVAQVMIHLPSVSTEGDRYDHLGSIDLLDSITDSILNAYAIKCGPLSSRDELRRLMKTSAWLTAPEAKGLGLVDRILGEETIDPAAILNCAGGTCHGIRSMAAGRTTLGALREEYARLVAQGKAPARGGLGEPPEEDPEAEDETALQAAKAKLELEKIRFVGGYHR